MIIVGSLLRKELRNLLPLAVLVVLSLGGDLITEPFSSRWDEIVWSQLGNLAAGESSVYAWVLLSLTLALAYSLFPREHDEGTIDFLHSLPVSRASVFLTKILAAWLVISSGIVLEQVVYWALSLTNPNSLSGSQFQLSVAAGEVLIGITFSAIMLCHGTLMSFFRTFGLLAYALLAWGFVALKQLYPSLRHYDPMALMALHFKGSHLLIPWREIGVHAVLAAAALGLAGFLWSVPAERVVEVFQRPLLRFGLGLAMVITGCVAFGLVMGSQTGPAADVSYPRYGVATLETEHYRFTYPVSLRERARQIALDADGCYERVRASLGAAEGNPIIGDLTEVSHDHAGLAGWQKVRIDIVSNDNPLWLRHILYHETTHVFQFQESGRRMSDNGFATRFFAEGLAEYEAYRLVDTPDVLAASRLLAATIVQRHHLRFEDLADARVLRQHFDQDLVYPLGEVWVAALVDVYGEAAPGKVLRAMDRPDAPTDLKPIAFWQDTLQACGYDLEHVLAAWRRRLAATAAAAPEFMQAMPRLSGGVEATDHDWVILIATLDRAPLTNAKYYVLTRRDAEDDEPEGWAGSLASDGRVIFRIPRQALPDRTLQFQFALKFSPLLPRPYTEKWQSTTLP